MADEANPPPNTPHKQPPFRKYAEGVSEESIRDSTSTRTHAFGAMIVLFFPIIMYLLICFWPHYRQESFERITPAAAAGDTSRVATMRWVRTEGVMADSAVIHVIACDWFTSSPKRGLFGIWIRRVPFAVEPEKRFLIIAVLAGMLGGLVHMSNSFAAYVGGLQLLWSWWWYYALRSLIGGALGLIVYFVLRAGLVAGSTGVDQLNPYGVAAICALCGLFSKQAMNKLQEVMEHVLNVREELLANRLDSRRNVEAEKAAAEKATAAKAAAEKAEAEAAAAKAAAAQGGAERPPGT